MVYRNPPTLSCFSADLFYLLLAQKRAIVSEQRTPGSGYTIRYQREGDTNMSAQGSKEQFEKLSMWKDWLNEIASQVGDVLPGRKARSCQHYLFQSLVMLLAHRAMLEAYLMDIGELPEDEPPAPTDVPF